MKTSIRFLLIMIISSSGFISKAQVNLESAGFKIGNAAYTPLILDNKFGIEEYENGFNLWVAWPSRGYGNYKLFIDQSGRVGIGRKPTTYKLEVQGGIYLWGLLYQTSDARLKQEIQDLDKLNTIDIVKNLSGKQYTKKYACAVNPEEEVKKLVQYGKIKPEEESIVLADMIKREEEKVPTTEFGFIAQELKEYLPDLVIEGEDGYLAVDYIGMIPILVESIKELKKIVEKQDKELDVILSDYNNIK